MKGWSCRKKPAVQKNCKILGLGGILKTSSFDWSNLTALQTVYINGLHIYFLGGKLSLDKITNQSVAMLQMDLVLLMLCDSPIFSGMCFCHTLIDWADVSHANRLPLDECLYVCFESFIKKPTVQLFLKIGPGKQKRIPLHTTLFKKVPWYLGIGDNLTRVDPVETQFALV